MADGELQRDDRRAFRGRRGSHQGGRPPEEGCFEEEGGPKEEGGEKRAQKKATPKKKATPAGEQGGDATAESAEE